MAKVEDLREPILTGIGRTHALRDLEKWAGTPSTYERGGSKPQWVIQARATAHALLGEILDSEDSSLRNAAGQILCRLARHRIDPVVPRLAVKTLVQRAESQCQQPETRPAVVQCLKEISTSSSVPPKARVNAVSGLGKLVSTPETGPLAQRALREISSACPLPTERGLAEQALARAQPVPESPVAVDASAVLPPPA